ncbi:hypothetical protein BZG36_04286 [Bifiguratus adelaidae]|uniref:Dienelactone hydrolase domain-containing protein n=1 Tax=Bifiguratus adelaidae TaxID=1938954 RepID=A0A261XW89_9FUNG|nr:hypothetical protein BZG36_04286 [Bifiguratus adelaidae]
MQHSSEQACCSIPPVDSNYKAVGTVKRLGDMDVYMVGSTTSNRAIIVLYDVYGFHKNTKQFCDRLAEAGNVQVAMPDFFRGKPWLASNAGNREALVKWVTQVGTREKCMPDLNAVKSMLQKQGVNQIGLVGFCWGAKIAVQATGESKDYAAAALIHPSFISIDDAKSAQAPVMVLATKDEPDMTEYMEQLYAKPFGSKCTFTRFEDMHHGFAAARGDWENKEQNKRATEAIRLTVDFFRNNL